MRKHSVANDRSEKRSHAVTVREDVTSVDPPASSRVPKNVGAETINRRAGRVDGAWPDDLIFYLSP